MVGGDPTILQRRLRPDRECMKRPMMTGPDSAWRTNPAELFIEGRRTRDITCDTCYLKGLQLHDHRSRHGRVPCVSWDSIAQETASISDRMPAID
jgi:hypothetical protein